MRDWVWDGSGPLQVAAHAASDEILTWSSHLESFFWRREFFKNTLAFTLLLCSYFTLDIFVCIFWLDWNLWFGPSFGRNVQIFDHFVPKLSVQKSHSIVYVHIFFYLVQKLTLFFFLFLKWGFRLQRACPDFSFSCNQVWTLPHAKFQIQIWNFITISHRQRKKTGHGAEPTFFPLIISLFLALCNIIRSSLLKYKYLNLLITS